MHEVVESKPLIPFKIAVLPSLGPLAPVATMNWTTIVAVAFVLAT